MRKNLLGLGFCCFARDILPSIRRPPSSSLRSKVQITHALQTMHPPLRPVFLEGGYVNVTFESDLAAIESPVADGKMQREARG